MSKKAGQLVALAAAAIVLVMAAWFDSAVMGDTAERTKTSDPSGLFTMTVLGSLLVAGSVLLLGVLAWRSASVVVGVAYVVVGGFFAALPWLWWSLASVRSDVLPEALALAIRNLGSSTSGPSTPLERSARGC